MANNRKRTRKINFLKGYKVIITDHCIKQYVKRTGVTYKEARETLESKFRNSKLGKFLEENKELRKEVSGDMNKRLTFVSIKRGRTFLVKSCWLQGSKRDWWKQNHNESFIHQGVVSNA